MFNQPSVKIKILFILGMFIIGSVDQVLVKKQVNRPISKFQMVSIGRLNNINALKHWSTDLMLIFKLYYF